MIEFPNVNGLSVGRAALAYVEAGIPIVPFDPSKGNHKQCGNLVGNPNDPDDRWYRHVTVDHDQIRAWRGRFGKFEALATSPGQFGCLVIDLDYPEHWPATWRRHLQSAPYVNTRSSIRHKGHYWFTLTPTAPAIGNRSFIWGELRSVGGGIVLPPYTNRDTGEARTVVRSGAIPRLPDELAQSFIAGAVGVGELVDLAEFLGRHCDETKGYKLKGVAGIFDREMNRSRHNAARIALTVGFGEARLGYVAAQKVYDSIRWRWTKTDHEFRALARWCASVAQSTPLDELKAKSDRTKGSDSRRYATQLAI